MATPFLEGLRQCVRAMDRVGRAKASQQSRVQELLLLRVRRGGGRFLDVGFSREAELSLALRYSRTWTGSDLWST